MTKPKLLFGKYHIGGLIGAGGMAEVYRAESTGPEGFKKTFCVKRILPRFARDQHFTKMLIDEAKVTSQLNHPNVVQVLDLRDEEGEYYLVMEHVDGCDLLRVLTSRARAKESLSVPLVLHLMAEVAKGLHYAHKATNGSGVPLNIVHRDVSPSNILLSRQGDVKVSDFGVAHADGTSSQDVQRRAGALKGKLGYMSPELVQKKKPDLRSDIFALGVVCWESLTLRRLFLGKTEVETLINVRDVLVAKKFKRHNYLPKPVQDIILKALSPDPAGRYETALDFHDAIMDYLFETRARVTSRDVASLVEEALSDKKEKTPESQAASTTPEPKPRRGPLKRRWSRRTLPSDTDTFPSPFRTPAPKPPDAKGSPWQVFTKKKSNPDPGTASAELRDASFRLRDHDGSVFGPIAYDNLLRLLASASVIETEDVSVNEGPWVWLSSLDIPELDALSQGYRGRTPEREGVLNPIRTPQLFYELSRDGMSGALVCSQKKIRKEILFREGMVVGVRSNLKAELLANFMRDHHLISTEQITLGLQYVQKHGGRLGRGLVAQGVLKGADLTRVLERQFRHRILQLFSWDQGWYAFYDEETSERLEHGAVIDPVSFMAEGVREYCSLELLKEMFASEMSHALHFTLDRNKELERFAFNKQEREVIQRIRPAESLDQALLFYQGRPREAAALLRVVFTLFLSQKLTLESLTGAS